MRPSTSLRATRAGPATHTTGPHDELDTAREAVWKEYVSVRLVGHADVPDAATALLTLIDGVVRGDDRFDAGRWPTAIGAFADRARGDLIPADRPREVSPSSEAPRDTSA